ncbi:MAG: hypothetical protein GXO47_06965 [Chlorobi bacterium]|nr:hypothetical protein [Chlorobiota bacterium]
MTQIDNSKQARKISYIFSVTIIILMIILGAYYVFDIELTDKELMMPLTTLLGLIIIAYRFGGFENISVEFGDDNLEIKYYRLFPFDRDFNRLVIPVELLGDYKIQKGIGSLFSYLILYQNRAGAMAQYPPIGLSATTSEFRSKLLSGLNNLREP